MSADGSIGSWVETLAYHERFGGPVRAQLSACHQQEGNFFNSAVTPSFNCMLAMYDYHYKENDNASRTRFAASGDDGDSVGPSGFTSFRYFGTFSTKPPTWLPGSHPPKRWPEDNEVSIWLAQFTSERACADYTQHQPLHSDVALEDGKQQQAGNDTATVSGFCRDYGIVLTANQRLNVVWLVSPLDPTSERQWKALKPQLGEWVKHAAHAVSIHADEALKHAAADSFNCVITIANASYGPDLIDETTQAVYTQQGDNIRFFTRFVMPRTNTSKKASKKRTRQ